MTRLRWLLLLLCCFTFPFTARADGIDLPILLGFGLGIFLPLLLFNAAIEAPIMGRFLGIKLSDLWWPWFKANVWSLLGGIPALVINELLAGWLLPTELVRRFQVYPLFLVLFAAVFFAATWLVEFVCARSIVRRQGVKVERATLVKAVLLANVASYAILGPAFCVLQYPRPEVREFTRDTRWAKQPALAVVAVGPTGRLETATADGKNHRVILPYEVRDFVVSADLKTVLYRGQDDRFYSYRNGTNALMPELGFWCRTPEMDFSPSGRYAAFLNQETKVIRIFDSMSGQFKDVPTFGDGYRCSVVWSSKEDTIYLKSEKDFREITLGPGSTNAYTALRNPPSDFAGHYGRVGDRWRREGAFYLRHRENGVALDIWYWAGSGLAIHRGRENLMKLSDPAGQLGFTQGILLEGGEEALVGFGNHVYLVDVVGKRLGPVLGGKDFIALAKPFSKQADFY